MGIEQIAFEIPKYIAKGIANGKYIRIGGVVRDASTGAIIKMLKEVPKATPKVGNAALKKVLIPLGTLIISAGADAINNHKDDIKNSVNDFIDNKILKKNSPSRIYENVTDFKDAKKNIKIFKKA